MERLWGVDGYFLLIVAVIAVLVAWRFRRFPQSRLDRRFPSLFAGTMARHMEAIAHEHPFRHLVIDFLAILGGLSVIDDLFLPLSPVIRYGTAAIVSISSLYGRRVAYQSRVAARRA